jgi:hypothetical protein
MLRNVKQTRIPQGVSNLSKIRSDSQATHIRVVAVKVVHDGCRGTWCMHLDSRTRNDTRERVKSWK